MLKELFPIESQVGLFRVIASNSAKLVKTNFGNVYPYTDAIVKNVKFCPKHQSPSVFLPPPIETNVATSPATTSSRSFRKKSSKKKKRIIKSIFGIL